ncbi:MAG: DUF349 domain-containing protein [Dysgonomonas mossii]|uniref:DUF349 domain-containing protein n=2 Tax=Dysgonomonadaceae TaxID=2005520 RepID=A0A4Y9IPU4_9BACT|nr:DUF349 domain-containing protein [Dysgonomonas mossii]MBS5797670.1 DUF349 domain-containing protein [Dysgonomonas mossii]MBS7109583.1 DUF349 domain-containing protein [Dysgonomonas mossii]TFU90322.1 DUF349 domain-containing protein [Dysgonomonas mossii]
MPFILKTNYMNENLNPELPENNLPEEVTNQSVEEEAKEQSETSTETSVAKQVSLTKDEIIEKLKNLTAQTEIPSRAEVESLKQAFYKLRSAAIEEQKAEFIEAGNDAEAFVPAPDPSEDVLKTFLSELKEKRASQAAAEENLKEENYNKKLQIIESIKNLTESSDDFNKLYKEFKDLQQGWNDVTSVPQSKEKELWKSYQIYTEKFYDLIKINNEFRDYDFKKNLELKNAICESVEKLIDDTDSVSAFHQLQNFHQQWREIGPVARELREEIWTRFKNASTAINKKYQTHFESLKGREEENLVEKTAICEALKNIDYSTLTSFKEWDEKSKEVIELQAKWKTIGFVPKKVNNQIFEEFRSLCDAFFEKKSEFFKGVRGEMDENLDKKRALTEQAKALKDSTDWKSTTDKLIAIQKEWKTIGPVPRKYSDAIWKEFVTACDYFFEQKKKNESSQKSEELDNLAAKKEIIEKIKNVDQSLDSSELIAKVRELADEWHKIGFVPFKEKDKIYKEFHQAVDAHYDRLKVDKTERRFESFKSNIKDISKQDNPKRALYRERDHLMHQYNKVKSDLQTYENNMNFLSISSKGASGLLKDVNNKIEKLKEEMELLVKKIEALDENLNELEK